MVSAKILLRNFTFPLLYQKSSVYVLSSDISETGDDDELMLAGNYADALHAFAPSADVKLIPGVNHMGIVSVSKAVSAVAEDVATHGMTGS